MEKLFNMLEIEPTEEDVMSTRQRYLETYGKHLEEEVFRHSHNSVDALPLIPDPKFSDMLMRCVLDRLNVDCILLDTNDLQSVCRRTAIQGPSNASDSPEVYSTTFSISRNVSAMATSLGSTFGPHVYAAAPCSRAPRSSCQSCT